MDIKNENVMEIEIQKNGLGQDELKIVGTYAGSVINELSNSFSVVNTGAFFARQYGFKMPSKIFGVTPFGTFKIGLIFDVLKFLKANYSNIKIKLTNEVKYEITKRLPLREFAKLVYKGPENISKEYEARNYQLEIIDAIIKKGYGRCMFECPTGSGKSFIIANLIYTLRNQYKKNLRSLLFLPNAQLVSQFYKDLKDYGYNEFEVLEFSATNYKKINKDRLKNASIIIANRQFLFNHVNELPKFDLMIIDEVHSAVSHETAKTINDLDIPLKIGCSGTIPTDKSKYWNLLSLVGPIVYRESITHLQEEGYLTNVNFTVIQVKDHIVEADKNLLFNLHPNVRYSQDGESEISFSDPYIAETNYMAKYCMELYSPVLTSGQFMLSQNENTLILFDRIEFGKALFKYLSDIKFNGAEICYIDGSVPIADREKIRAMCEQKNNVILIAQSSTMSTGINIKNMSNLIMTGSCKSQSRIIQSIGRTLRLHKDKSHSNVIDIVYNYKYSKKHYAERRELYKKYYNKSKPDETIKIEINY